MPTGYNFFLMDNAEDAFQLFMYHALKESQECRPSKMSMFQGATFSCIRKQRLSITTDSTVRTVPTEEIESRIEVMQQESKEIIQAFNDARELDPTSCYYFLPIIQTLDAVSEMSNFVQIRCGVPMLVVHSAQSTVILSCL